MQPHPNIVLFETLFTVNPMASGSHPTNLGADIQARGQTTPIFVRPIGTTHFELFSGYRRLAALKQAGVVGMGPSTLAREWIDQARPSLMARVTGEDRRKERSTSSLIAPVTGKGRR